MGRLCRTCGEEIPEARLKAKPDAVQCVPCLTANGDEPPVAGHMQWDHKTAPQIEIGTQLAASRRNAHPRQGKSTSTIFGTGECDFDSEDFMVVNERPARCHPERRAVAAGRCLECAIAWYGR